MVAREPVAVVVLARAPLAGRAKTRLIPALGANGAAALQAALTLRAVGTARRAGTGPVRLCCAPDPGHVVFELCRDRFGATLHGQSGADLGERMHHALDEALADAAGAVLIGTDVPTIDAGYLRRAAGLLRAGREAVFGPAEDGGYVLVGLRRPLPALFKSVPWGTDRVWTTTQDRLVSQDIDWQALPRLWDIDTPADLERLARERPALRRALDKTAWRLVERQRKEERGK